MKALVLNCSLKKSDEESNTEALIKEFTHVFNEHQIESEIIRIADYNIAFGIEPDMGNGDEWPKIAKKMEMADILLVGSPVWIGEKSSIAKMVMERISASGADTKENGQPIFYNKVAGVAVTGNEDGAKHAARDILFTLGQFGYTIPPNALSYWVGDAGPGPSYIEAHGEEHDFTIENAKVASHNLVHMARILMEDPIPADGNTEE